MKIILLKDVENIGKKLEVKDVKDGHARNFLIPQGLAKPATRQAMKWLDIQKEIETKKEEEALKGIQEIASKIDGTELLMLVKVGDEGQLFEKINAQKIQEKLKEIGFEVSKNQVLLQEPIKELGEFPVKIKFDHNLESEIKVIISEEKI